MSKELEALARQKANVKELRKTRFIEYSDDFALIELALKRNHPVKLLKEYGEERFEYDEWYMPVGRCPLCNELNPVDAKYCIECGQALEKIEDGEYHHE